MSQASNRRVFAAERRAGVILLAPLLTFLAISLLFPLGMDFVYSLSRISFTALWSPHWRGLGNFMDVLSDPVFWQAAGFSLRFAVIATVAEVILGFLLVLILNPLLERHGWLIAFLILPMMISPALIGIMYRLMLNDFVGIIPQYLEMIGIEANLLGPQWVFSTLVVIEVLQWTPFALLALLAAYQTIPRELTEAVWIDGGGARAVFSFVTWPFMLPALGITAFIRFVDSFRVFDQIYVLTGGGPGTMTTSMSLYIYRAFFEKQQIGLAVAASLLLLVASAVVLRFTLTRLLRSEPA